MLPLFSTTISTKQLYDMIEVIEVHDCMKKLAQEQAAAEANKNKQVR